MQKYNPEEYRKQQEDLKAKISNQIKEITSSWSLDIDTINEYIKFASKFHRYSFNNTVLIYMQNPKAAYCGSFQYFKEQGYNIKKGEKGMKVFVPVKVTLFREDETDDWKQVSNATKEEKEKIKKGYYQTKQILRFKIGTVFDIAQTDCPVENYPKYFHFGYDDKTQNEIYNGLTKFAKTIKCPVKIEDISSISTRGYYAPNTHSITLSHLLKDSEKNSVLAHELGHALMHNAEYFKAEDKKPSIQKELEADIMGLLIVNHLNLEISDRRKEHLVSQWKKIQNYNKSVTEEEKITLEKELTYVQNIFNNNVDKLSESINPQKVITNNTIEQYCDQLFSETQNTEIAFEI